LSHNKFFLKQADSDGAERMEVVSAPLSGNPRGSAYVFKHMTFSRSFLSVLTFVLLAARVFAQGPDVTLKVDEYVRAEMEKRKVPGAAIAVVRDGKVVLAKGYGLASVELNSPVTVDTVFQTASIGKQFTATAVMMLVEQGKISLDEKIGKYLGDVPASWSGITVRHLLTHTSGLAAYPPGFDFRKDYTEDELLKIIQNEPPEFAPGEKWHYSNAGYLTLGVLIRKVTGKSYGEFFADNIFKPLGMTTARLINELVIIPNRAAGYILNDGQLLNQPWISHTLNRTADGSLYMSVLDLAKWDAALYSEKLLKSESLAQMWTPVRLNNGSAEPYGFGWYIMDAKGHRLIEHEGAWQGFNANIARYVDDKLTVIVLTNLKSAGAPMMSHGIAGIYLPAVAPTYYKAVADTEPKITELAKNVMKQLASGTADQGLFTAEGRAAFFPNKANMYGSYLKPIGDPVKVVRVEPSNKAAANVHKWEFYYKSRILLVSLTLDKSGRIVELEALDNY
jgi:CubicO group peptidase (beta-lactamase class C family)